MIETNQILQTDLLDILFDGRNKEYGAYELRKKYNKRMMVAVISMMICCTLLFLLFSLASERKGGHLNLILPDVELIKLKPDEPKPEQLPPPPKTVQPQIKTVQFTTPKLTSKEIKPEDEMPDKEVLDDTKIGKVSQPGIDDPDAVAPPISDDRGVTEAPKKKEDDLDKIHLVVQIESEYPGGLESWVRFLKKNTRYPQDAIDNEIQGTVMVQFIVDRSGSVSEVEAVSGPNELRDEAVRVIRKSGKWTPAVQNGLHVKSYKKQPITFALDQ